MNFTRRSSACNVLKQYISLNPFLPHLNITSVTDSLLSSKQNWNTIKHIDQLKMLYSVAKVLQGDESTINNANTLFDIIISDILKTTTQLDRSAEIIHSSTFESAITKIQNRLENVLSEAEHNSVVIFVYKKLSNLLNNNNLSYARRAFKKKSSLEVSGGMKYMGTLTILPASNICERCFCTARFILEISEKNIILFHAEEQFFLHFNRAFWDLVDVQMVLNKDQNDEPTTSTD